MMQQLKDKRCLIVGGTTGIGRAAAAYFLEAGARVIVSGRDPAKGRSVATDLSTHGEIVFVAADASIADQVDELYLQATQRLGGLDVLYHVAGISGRSHGDGPLHECSDAGWQATLAANLTSVFLTNRAAVRHF